MRPLYVWIKFVCVCVFFFSCYCVSHPFNYQTSQKNSREEGRKRPPFQPCVSWYEAAWRWCSEQSFPQRWTWMYPSLQSWLATYRKCGDRGTHWVILWGHKQRVQVGAILQDYRPGLLRKSLAWRWQVTGGDGRSIEGKTELTDNDQMNVQILIWSWFKPNWASHMVRC